MPKMKSRRSAVKRFKVTGTGKVRRRQSCGKHLATCKTTKRKRQLRKELPVHETDAARVRKMIAS
ncbi:50S ribosomal protein L35 [bacterium]|nr:50S ribosomal protein L35 [bacterium]